MIFRVVLMLVVASSLCQPALSEGNHIIVERASGKLPPGFDIQGPDKFWSCRGADSTRARFVVLDREKLHKQMSRMAPQFTKNLSDTYDEQEIRAMDADDMAAMRDIRQRREPAEDQLQANLPQVQAQIDDGFRNSDVQPRLHAIFEGSMNGQACELDLRAKLKASHGAQIVSNVPDETKFSISVLLPGDVTQIQAGGVVVTVPNQGPWEACDDQYEHQGSRLPCPPGEMVLEHLQVNHISGSFRFPVKKEVSDNHEVIRFVAGFFNATSEQTEDSDTLLDYMSRGRSFGRASITKDGQTIGEDLSRLATPGKLIPTERRKKIAPD